MGNVRRLLPPAALALALGACSLLPTPVPTPAPTPTLRAVYRVMPSATGAATPDDLEAIRRIILGRLNETGLALVRVSAEGEDRIVVEAAATGEAADLVRELAGTTGDLAFIPLGTAGAEVGDAVDTAQHPPLFSGNLVAGASIGVDQTGRRTLDLVLREPATRLLADYTAGHIGEYLAITLDGRVISAPVIQGKIPGGEVQLAGPGKGFDLATAQRLIAIVKYGALPFPLQQIESSGG